MSYQLISFIIAWISLSLCVFGLINNTISILIYSHPTMRSPINILLVGLSTIDFLLCLLAILAFCIPGMAAYYDNAKLDTYTHYAAAYVYPWTMITQTCSVWTFVVITFERWVAVCYPFKARWCTIKGSLRALAAVACLAFLYNLPRFFEFQLVWKIEDGKEVVQAAARLRNATTHRTYMTVYYCAFYLLTHFAIPFSILLIGNTFMVMAVYRARRQRALLTIQENREHKTACMMILVVFVFVCCNTLAFVLNFVEEVDPNFFVSKQTARLAWILNDVSNLLVVFYASSTAIIYTACSEKYRRLLISMFCGPERFCRLREGRNKLPPQKLNLARYRDNNNREKKLGSPVREPLLQAPATKERAVSLLDKEGAAASRDSSM